MDVDFEIFDIESIEKRIETLETNLFSMKNFGYEKLVGRDVAIPVYELTINYLKELIKNVHKLKLYSRAYAKKLHNIVNMESYKAGDNIFVDQCIRATNQAERIIEEG